MYSNEAERASLDIYHDFKLKNRFVSRYRDPQPQVGENYSH